jgi:hypothetical protein
MELVYSSSSTAKVNNTDKVVHGTEFGNSEPLRSRCMVSSADAIKAIKAMTSLQKTLKAICTVESPLITQEHQ